MWSIGIILYLLVTGGVNDKRHEEHFDFKEPIWYNVSEELKEFMLMAVNEDLNQRASIQQLLLTDFVKMAKENSLDKTPLDETHLSDLGGNMYKFYMAHCINEITFRFRLNIDKLKDVASLKEKLIDARKIFETPASNKNLLHIEDFKKELVTKFGEYEAHRISNFFEMNESYQFTFEEAFLGVTQLFNEDLDEIIA